MSTREKDPWVLGESCEVSGMASQTIIRLLDDGPVLRAIQTLFESANDLYVRGTDVLTTGIMGRVWNSEGPE
jgi:hypothetical protein